MRIKKIYGRHRYSDSNTSYLPSSLPFTYIHTYTHTALVKTPKDTHTHKYTNYEKLHKLHMIGNPGIPA